MLEFMLSPHVALFTFSIGILIALMTLELVASLLGGSFLSLDTDTDLDLDADLDADTELDGAGGVLGWLGLGKMPIMIWVAAVLTGFGISGLMAQSITSTVIGTTLPFAWVTPVAIAAGLWFARTFGAVFAAVLPKTETTATSERFLGGRQGVVTQGTARRGSPAEVRVTDRHGNTHYLRAEPFEDDETLSQGTDVYVVRTKKGAFRLIPID